MQIDRAKQDNFKNITGNIAEKGVNGYYSSIFLTIGDMISITYNKQAKTNSKDLIEVDTKHRPLKI